MSDVLLSFEQLDLVGWAVVIEVALGGGDAAVGHADGFDLAGGGDAREAFIQCRAAALGAGGAAAGAHQGFKRVAAGLAVVVVNRHGDLLRSQTGAAQRSLGEAQPSPAEADAGFVPRPTQASTAAVSKPTWRLSLSVRCIRGRRINSGSLSSSVSSDSASSASGWISPLLTRGAARLNQPGTGSGARKANRLIRVQWAVSRLRRSSV